jgi:hypothetical protein
VTETILAKLESIEATLHRLGWPRLTDEQRKRFLERGTLCPSAATMVRKRYDGKKPKEKKS